MVEPRTDQYCIGLTMALATVLFAGTAQATDVEILVEPETSATILARGVWPANNHEYVFVEFPGESWDAASASLVSLLPGYHLATITSQEEQDFINDLGATHFVLGEFWLGGVQDPITEPVADKNWVWVTGEPWDYTNWHSGEPNDAHGPGNEQHLALFDAAWNDEGSNIGNIRGYMAEDSCLSTEDLDLSDEGVINDIRAEEACNSITAGGVSGGYSIVVGGDVTFTAPEIILTNGFEIDGGEFRAVNAIPVSP